MLNSRPHTFSAQSCEGFKIMSSTTASRSRDVAKYFLGIGAVFLCYGGLLWFLEGQLNLIDLIVIVASLVLVLIGAGWFLLRNPPK